MVFMFFCLSGKKMVCANLHFKIKNNEIGTTPISIKRQTEFAAFFKIIGVPSRT